MTVGVRSVICAVVMGVGLSIPGEAVAAPIPLGWTCSGNCGSLGADGDVPTPPVGGSYVYVSTDQAPAFMGLNLGFNETNGSLATSPLFSASGTDLLAFNFNFVTSDGAGFPEYAYVRLLPSGGSPILLFTARTCETTPCNTVPGEGMPALGAGVVLNPPTTPVIANATNWSPLGDSSGTCFDIGCGNSGWIAMNFMPAAGNYRLEFGVVNVNDQSFQSGLAVAGVTIGGVLIDDPGGTAAVPEPGTMLLVGSGLAYAWRRRHARKAA
jgi:hypothetical protein